MTETIYELPNNNILGDIDAVCRWLHQESGEWIARPIDASDLPELMHQFGIVKYVEPEQEPQQPIDYRMQRAMAYPPIQEQLDMQYWDAMNGTTVWLDCIDDIKARFPKV